MDRKSQLLVFYEKLKIQQTEQKNIHCLLFILFYLLFVYFILMYSFLVYVAYFGFIFNLLA